MVVERKHPKNTNLKEKAENQNTGERKERGFTAKLGF